MTLIIALLLFIPKILIGFAIAHLLWKDSDFAAIFLKFAIGIPLGLAISASLFFIAVVSGILPSTYSWLEFFGFSLTSLLFLSRSITARKEHRSFIKPSNHDLIGAFIMLMGALLFISAFRHYSRMHPYGFEDTWTMWNLTARYIFRDNSPAIFLNSQFYNRFHPDYPVNLPLNVAWGWFILQRESLRVPMAISLLTVFSSSAVTWATLRKWKGIVPATLGGLMVMITSNIPSAIRQDADPLLALYFLSATACMYGYLKSKNQNLLFLAGLLAGFAAWVKNEGIFFIGVFLIVCLFAIWRQEIEWREIKHLMLGLLIPVLVVWLYKTLVAWQSDVLSGTDSPYLKLLDLSRWMVIGKNLFFNIMDHSNWPISIVVVLVVFSMLMGFDPENTRHQLLLLLIFTGQLAGYFFVYLITPFDLELHIHTSMDRLVSHVFPSALLWIFVLLQSPGLKDRQTTG